MQGREACRKRDGWPHTPTHPAPRPRGQGLPAPRGARASWRLGARGGGLGAQPHARPPDATDKDPDGDRSNDDRRRHRQGCAQAPSGTATAATIAVNDRQQRDRPVAAAEPGTDERPLSPLQIRQRGLARRRHLLGLLLAGKWAVIMPILRGRLQRRRSAKYFPTVTTSRTDGGASTNQTMIRDRCGPPIPGSP